MQTDILVVDDEPDIRELVSDLLEDEGYSVRLAPDGQSALTAVQDRKPSLVILDVWMQGDGPDGLEVLKSLTTTDPNLPVIMISGHGTIEMAVTAIQNGAYDFLEKPFQSERLRLIVKRALESAQLKHENSSLRALSRHPQELIGQSTAINMVRNTIAKVAPTNSRILIEGPSGSGKELAARLIHAQSLRAGGPFVAVNAAAMTPEHMEAELFGIEETPGSQRRVGAFEQAHGGTLYLDEVGDMPLETQAKILRVLLDQRFHRVGGAQDVNVDVRVISSTAKDLQKETANQRFREDLYHRLAVVPIHMPSLTERREDIPILIETYMLRLSQQSPLKTKPISDEAMAILQTYEWPGNVRQLRNISERLMILTSGQDDKIIEPDDLPSELTGGGDTSSAGAERVISLSLREAREVFEREYLTAQIARFGGNISRTAAFIGMERSALHRKLKSLRVGESAAPSAGDSPLPQTTPPHTQNV